jgi:hypothetical protein
MHFVDVIWYRNRIEWKSVKVDCQVGFVYYFKSPNIRRVSSVLNKDNKNYGKKNLIDGTEETCWNSEAVWLFVLYVFQFIFIIDV